MIPGLSSFSATSALAATGAPASAVYTLLGVAITAVVTLLAVVVKYAFDSRADARRYQRELAAKDRDHAHDLEKLQLELQEARRDALRDLRRRVYASYLAETHTIYLSIVDARRRRRTDADDGVYRTALKSISPAQAQVALEECRLVDADASAARADELWNLLRSHPVPQGLELSAAAWAEWKRQYWDVRRDFIDQCNADLSV